MATNPRDKEILAPSKWCTRAQTMIGRQLFTPMETRRKYVLQFLDTLRNRYGPAYLEEWRREILRGVLCHPDRKDPIEEYDKYPVDKANKEAARDGFRALLHNQVIMEAHEDERHESVKLPLQSEFIGERFQLAVCCEKKEDGQKQVLPVKDMKMHTFHSYGLETSRFGTTDEVLRQANNVSELVELLLRMTRNDQKRHKRQEEYDVWYDYRPYGTDAFMLRFEKDILEELAKPQMAHVFPPYLEGDPNAPRDSRLLSAQAYEEMRQQELRKVETAINKIDERRLELRRIRREERREMVNNLKGCGGFAETDPSEYTELVEDWISDFKSLKNMPADISEDETEAHVGTQLDGMREATIVEFGRVMKDENNQIIYTDEEEEEELLSSKAGAGNKSMKKKPAPKKKDKVEKVKVARRPPKKATPTEEEQNERALVAWDGDFGGFPPDVKLSDSPSVRRKCAKDGTTHRIDIVDEHFDRQEEAKLLHDPDLDGLTASEEEDMRRENEAAAAQLANGVGKSSGKGKGEKGAKGGKRSKAKGKAKTGGGAGKSAKAASVANVKVNAGKGGGVVVPSVSSSEGHKPTKGGLRGKNK